MLSLINGCVGDALGKEYVDEYFPESHLSEMTKMITHIRGSFEDVIKNLDWMSEVTKKKALLKLENMKQKIGYPNKYIDFSELTLDPKSSLVNNVMTCRRFHWKRMMKTIGKKVDEDKWSMLPHTVNAYYSPNRNEIVFPAAILQEPFFIPGDPNTNFGGIGAVIGHEIIHGFDDSGCKFDHTGKLNNWWTAKDKARFDDKTSRLVDQYRNFKLEGLNLNGELTLGENIADLGGLEVAYKAFVSSGMRSEADKRLFFQAFAKLYRNKATPERVRLLIETDPHSPGQFRVDGVVQNMRAFDEVFGLKLGDPMFRKDKVKIW